MKNEFHMGRLIRAELDRQRLKVTWLAEAICVERSVCYDIFKRRFVDAEQLERISRALNYNFFNDLAKYEDGFVKKPTEV